MIELSRRKMLIQFPSENISVTVELLDDQAPNTCEGIWRHLPLSGPTVHGIYSGSEAVLFLDSSIKLPEENITSRVVPGDIGYTFIPGGKYVDIPNDIAEIAIFYGRDAQPMMPDGPWPVNIFGRVIEGLDDLARVCRSLRWEGAKTATVVKIEP